MPGVDRVRIAPRPATASSYKYSIDPPLPVLSDAPCLKVDAGPFASRLLTIQVVRAVFRIGCVLLVLGRRLEGFRAFGPGVVAGRLDRLAADSVIRDEFVRIERDIWILES
jgi:hypothetical protein